MRDFLYYLLSNFDIASNASGTALPYLTVKVLSTARFQVPDLSTQRRMAEILSAYDDLIENNRRRIRLLEQAARLLYKEWFVRLRFPGHERALITSGVPEGWEKKSLGDVILDLQSGGRPKGGTVDEGVPSIGAENVVGIGKYDYSKERFISEEYFANMRQGVVKNRDVAIYKDGANIGRSSYFGNGFPHEQCAVNEHVFICRGRPEIGQNFLYFWVSQNETRQRIANLNANTAQPGISQHKLKTLTFVQPSQNLLDRFNSTVEPLIRQVFLIGRKNRKLVQVRNLLLPHLMDGKVKS